MNHAPNGQNAAVSGLRTSRPPSSATELDVWVLTTTTQLRELRAALAAALYGDSELAGRPLDDVPERMVLVATELATNAIRHADPPTEVRLSRTAGEFVLDVADHDPTTVPELTATRPLDSGGRGLMLAREFSLDVGWYATDDAKHIWATFPLGA
jgi:serine/threonine-protein kinase RsbW